jgi:zinc transporter, ZIP family
MDAVAVSFLAGSSTLFGFFLIFFIKNESSRIISYSLSFSAGIMIYLSFMEILPKGLAHLKSHNVSPFIGVLSFLLGIALIIIIDRFTAQYGHKQENLSKIGFLSLILITIHNIPEGISVYSVAKEELSMSLPLLLAIGLHNLPEGIIISVPIYAATKNKLKTFFYTALAALSEPIGGISGYYVMKSIFNDLTLGLIFCFISGIMVFLSVDQLLPEARENGDHHKVGYAFILGMAFMAISLELLKL